MPPEKLLLRYASSKIRGSASPAASAYWDSATSAFVKVPVLSVQRISMAPRSWIEASRFTITRRSARRRAPDASVTVSTIGNSSGVRPTASARAKIRDSSHGLPETAFTAKTKSTRNIVRRIMSSPKSWMPRSKASTGRRSDSDPATAPSSVLRPVSQTNAVALPLMTDVPAKTAFNASTALLESTASRACFATGKASPVSRL